MSLEVEDGTGCRQEALTLVAMATFSPNGNCGDLICEGSLTFVVYSPELEVDDARPRCVLLLTPLGCALCVLAAV